MSATKENYRHSGDYTVLIPKASIDITSGDVVVMPHKFDPKSRSRLGTLSRISPIASADAAPWSVGVSDSDFVYYLAHTDTAGGKIAQF